MSTSSTQTNLRYLYSFPPDALVPAKSKEGKSVSFRSLTPGDKKNVLGGFNSLSEDTRYNRFLGIKKTLTSRELDYLCTPDNKNHVALLAYDGCIGYGVGRFVRLKDRPKTAELAITILDEHQHQGVGRLLFERLTTIALGFGVEQFVGYSLGNNDHIVRYLTRLGATFIALGEGVVEITVPLHNLRKFH